MKPNSRIRNAALIVAALALCALAGVVVACTFSVGGNPPTPCPTCPPFMGAYDAEPSGITTFNNLAAGDLTLSDDLTVAGDAAITGDAAVTGDTTLSGLAIFDAADLTVANTTLTPAASAYHLDSAGATTLTLTACANNGQLLILFGDDANTITLADSNIRTTDGNALSIGQYDLCLLVCYDTEWIELALAADS
jgi:hypothetical protein